MASKPKQFKPAKSGCKAFKKKSKYLTMEWVEYRNAFLAHNPKCYACAARATVVDHLIAWKVNPDELFLKKSDNFLPLCKPCHDYITGKFDAKVVPDTAGKIAWINWKRAQNDISIRVKVVSPKKVVPNFYSEEISDEEIN